MKKIFTLVFVVTSLLPFSQGVFATSDVLRFVGYGPISAGMGGVATAIHTGAAGMMTNPATLWLGDIGSEVNVGLDVITADISIKNNTTGEVAESTSHSNNRGPYSAPQLAYTYRNQSIAFGFGIFAHGGVGTEYGSNSFLSRATGDLDTGLDNSSRLLTINIPFAVGFEISDKFVVGASLDAVWQGLNLEMLMGADQIGSLIGTGRANGSLVSDLGSLPDLRGAHFSLSKDEFVGSGVDAWGYTGRIGILYKPNSNTTLGMAYTAESSVSDMKGQGALTAVDGAVGQLVMPGQIAVRDFQTPAQLNFGISHLLNDHWFVTADLSRVFWAHAMKNIDVDFIADSGGDLNILLPQNYRDQTTLSLGTAYQFDRWILRGGARVATQALRSDTVLAILPATPTVFSSTGFSYQLTRDVELDFAWVHSFEKTLSNSSLPNISVPIETVHDQDSFSITFSSHF